MLDAGGGVNQVLEMQRQNQEVLVRSLASGTMCSVHQGVALL